MTDPQMLRYKIVQIFALVIAVTIHEFSHAWAAYKLGDDYAARLGRLTLNPASHADPIGTILVPLFIGFGWGKPVPYIPTNLTRKFTMRAGEAMIAFAGPASNLILAIICGGLWVGLYAVGLIRPDSPADSLLQMLLTLNVALFFFNLIPVPPLDGSKIAAWAFGRKADPVLDKLQHAGPIVMIAVIAFGGTLIAPFSRVVVNGIVGGFAALIR